MFLVLKKVNINGHILRITRKKNSRGTNNCGQCVLEKNIFLIM